MILSSTARRYAEAAFDVAREHGEVAEWLRDIQAAAAALKGPSISSYFKDPNVSREDKLSTIDLAFSAVRPQVRNLLRMLAARDRLGLIPAILEEMTHLDREERGILEASITTARVITDAERRSMAERLATATGKQVELSTEVDPNVLGGVVIRIGDKLIDASVAGRFERLRQQLAV